VGAAVDGLLSKGQHHVAQHAVLSGHEPRRYTGDSFGEAADLGTGASTATRDGRSVNDGTMGRAGRPARGHRRIVAPDNDRLRVCAALGAGRLGVAMAREVVVELSQGGGAVFYCRIIDRDRLAFSSGGHQAGRRRVGLDGTPEG
jgi:hypothetical protein